MDPSEIKILLIEDNPNGACTLHDMLYSTLCDYQLIWTRNLHDAVHEIHRNSLDLIITNLNLPDSLGYKTFWTLKTVCPKTPIVVVNPYKDTGFRELLLREGASDFIVAGEDDEWALAKRFHRVLHFSNHSKERLKS